MTDLPNSNQKEPKIPNFELGTEIGSIRSQNTKYKQKLNHNNQLEGVPIDGGHILCQEMSIEELKPTLDQVCCHMHLNQKH